MNKPEDPRQPELLTNSGALQTSTYDDAETIGNIARPTPRAPGWKLRFLVMRRDNFRCLQCGKSPANNLGTVLVIDHITPWSKGGATVHENLRTLCDVCIGGRSNLDLKDEAI